MLRKPPQAPLGPWLQRRPPRVAGTIDLLRGTLVNHGWLRQKLVIRGDWGDPVEELDLDFSTAHLPYSTGEPERFLRRAESRRMARFVYEIEGDLVSLWVFRPRGEPGLVRFIAVWRQYVGEDYAGSARVVTDDLDRYVWRHLDYMVEWPRLQAIFRALFGLR